jgi:hypothetical protein
MKKILVIATLCLPFTVSAQKLLKPNVDKISGDTTWSTSKEKLYFHANYLTSQGEAVECWVEQIGKLKAKALVLNPQTTNLSKAFSILKDQKAYLKLSDNTTITLVSATYDYGTVNAGYAGDHLLTKGAAIAFYTLSDSDIEKIKSSPLTFLRIQTTNGDFDCDIKPKFSEVIKKEIELFENKK